ncbi:MAG TPA: outer membrane beta-barrel protein [Chthoniobacterales bacterium]|nr:outer membrane beta-barrel protein [Chthoniobacterales bacterium]
MKKILLTASVLIGCALPMVAGTEQYAGKEMKQVAPAPPPCPSWTGFYVGAFGGYKFGATDIDLDLTGTGWELFPDAADETKSRIENLDTSGAELGGLLGYNYQWNNWVLGLEAAGGYLWLRDSKNTDSFFDNNGNEYQTSASLKTHYLVTIGPRIGYSLCKWLPYVTGGVAFGDIDFEQHVNAYDFTSHQGGTTDDTNVGWMVGGGMEYALTDHWRVRLQYQFVDLGDADFDHKTDAPSFVGGHSEAELREHNVSFAIMYGF